MTKGFQVQSAIIVTLFFIFVAFFLFTLPILAWYPIGRDFAIARQFDASPGCNTNAFLSGRSDSCVAVDATIVSKWLSRGRRSTTNHFSLKSDSGFYTTAGVPDGLYSQTQIGDAVSATVWHGAVVELRTADGSISTPDNPDSSLHSDLSFATVVTVPTLALIALLAGSCISTARKNAERHGRYVARQADIIGASDPNGTATQTSSVAAKHPDLPPAIGDDAGLNQSDLWK